MANWDYLRTLKYPPSWQRTWPTGITCVHSTYMANWDYLRTLKYPASWQRTWPTGITCVHSSIHRVGSVHGQLGLLAYTQVSTELAAYMAN
ncbi:hypothetical protein J6590_056802 [Homalodisca vitripennis]|nr:hypothetical protein J6590_056802 [Homalodisca vitripennis]